MELSDKIRRAFASRPKPEEAVDVNNQIQMDSDVEEGMWFSGRNWQEITWKDWQAHSSAIYYFSKDAFRCLCLLSPKRFAFVPSKP
jgi:hypothetical protein